MTLTRQERIDDLYRHIAMYTNPNPEHIPVSQGDLKRLTRIVARAIIEAEDRAVSRATHQASGDAD